MPEARDLGGEALTFLAREPQRLMAFLAATGMSPQDLRASADADTTLLAVLQYLLDDESLLLVFTADTGAGPALVAPAAEVLAQEAARR